MTRITTAFASLLAVIALIVIAGLSACSGAVGGSPPVNDPTRITILPASTDGAIAYSGLPFTFTISGGTGAYIVSSSNQAIIAASGSINGSALTVTPSPVLVDTTVTITVRDTGTAPTATTTVTVKPGTVANDITVTPTSTQAAGCAPAICSGGDALVSTTISQGGIPLAARGVRFDVLSGTFSFVVTDPVTGTVTLVNTVQVVTDETGKAVARIRVPPNAQNQTALIQVTDLGTGTFQRTSFAIAQSSGSSPGFAILPSSIVFQGILTNQCAGLTGDIFAELTIVGGTPPYALTGGGSAFMLIPNVVTASGGIVDVKANGTCVPAPGNTIVATDALGHTATATVQNLPGTGTAPALTVTPSSITLTSCAGQANATVAGGVSSNYFASGGSDALTVTINGSNVTVGRRNPSAAVTGPLSVGVSDGSTVATLTVNLSGEGAGACPALVATPSTVTLTDCMTHETVNVTGGSGTYTATSDNSSVTVSPASGTTSPFAFDIFRTLPTSGAFTPPAHVTVRNGTASTVVTVNASGTGLAGQGNGSCP